MSTPGVEVHLQHFITSAPEVGSQPRAQAPLPTVRTEYKAHPGTVRKDTVYGAWELVIHDCTSSNMLLNSARNIYGSNASSSN